MKNCKFCYSEIHDRAKICPHCHNRLSLMGGLQAFLLTAFPILTAILSLGFAFFEKYEKGLVQDSLVQTESRLDIAEVQNSVAEEAVEYLTNLVPRSSAMLAAPDALGQIKTPEQILEELDVKIANVDMTKPNSRAVLKSLEKEKLENRFKMKLFPSTR